MCATSPKYLPTFAEETFITHCYGSEEEIGRFDELMQNPLERTNIVDLIILTEAIKVRHNLGMVWDCCWRCQRFSICEINWLRAERKIPKTCCPNCVNYRDCNRIFESQRSGKIGL